jgi:hypothetical protein
MDTQSRIGTVRDMQIRLQHSTEVCGKILWHGDSRLQVSGLSFQQPCSPSFTICPIRSRRLTFPRLFRRPDPSSWHRTSAPATTGVQRLGCTEYFTLKLATNGPLQGIRDLAPGPSPLFRLRSTTALRMELTGVSNVCLRPSMPPWAMRRPSIPQPRGPNHFDQTLSRAGRLNDPCRPI